MRLFIVLSVVIYRVCCENIVVNLDKDSVINVVSDKFLSFSVDPKLLIQTSDSNHSQECFCKGSSLSPAYIRIANPPTSKILVENSQLEVKDTLNNVQKVMDEENLQQFLNWIKLANLTPIFTLDNSDKLQCGNWDPKTAVDALAIIERANIDNCVWEFGEKCFSQTWKEYSSDVKLLRSLLDAFTYGKDKNWKISSGDISSCLGDNKVHSMMSFIMESSKFLDFLILNMDNNSLGLLDILNENEKNEVLMESALRNNEYWKILSVDDNIDDDEALIWLKSIGNAAKNGYSVIFKNLNFHDMNEPTLTYYVSLLHKKFVGNNVLNLDLSSEYKGNVSVFAHCARIPKGPIPNGITLYAANEGESMEEIIFNISINTQAEILQFILQRNDEKKIIVNGNELLHESYLEADIRNVSEFKKMKVSLPAKSIGFWIVPNVDIDVCSDSIQSSSQNNLEKEDIVIKDIIDSNKMKRSIQKNEDDKSTPMLFNKNEESLNYLITELENDLDNYTSTVSQETMLSILRRMDKIIELEKKILATGKKSDEEKNQLKNNTIDDFDHLDKTNQFNESFFDQYQLSDKKNLSRKTRDIGTNLNNPRIGWNIEDDLLAVENERFENVTPQDPFSTVQRHSSLKSNIFPQLMNETGFTNKQHFPSQKIKLAKLEIHKMDEIKQKLQSSSTHTPKIETLHNSQIPHEQISQREEIKHTIQDSTKNDDLNEQLVKSFVPSYSVGEEELLLANKNESNLTNVKEKPKIEPLTINEGDSKILNVKIPFPRIKYVQSTSDVEGDFQKDKVQLPKIELINMDKIKQRLTNSSIQSLKIGSGENLMAPNKNGLKAVNLKIQLPKIDPPTMQGAEQNIVNVKIPFPKLKSAQDVELIKNDKIRFPRVEIPKLSNMKNENLDSLVFKANDILKNQSKNQENYNISVSSKLHPSMKDDELEKIHHGLKKHEFKLHGFQEKLKAKAAEIEQINKSKMIELKNKMHHRLNKRESNYNRHRTPTAISDELVSMFNKQKKGTRTKRFVLASKRDGDQNLEKSVIEKISPGISYQPLKEISENLDKIISTEQIENLSKLSREGLKWEDVRESVENIDEKSFAKIFDNVKDFFYKMKDKMKGWF